MLTFLVKNGKMKLSGVFIIREYAKKSKSKSNLVLVIVLVLESKGLYFQFLTFEVSPTVYKKKKSAAGFPNVRSRSDT